MTREEENRRITVWRGICDKHPQLRVRSGVLNRFNDFMFERNRDVKPGERPRVDTRTGADLFFATEPPPTARELATYWTARAEEEEARVPEVAPEGLA